MNKKIITVVIVVSILLLSKIVNWYYQYSLKSTIENITKPEFMQVLEYDVGDRGYSCSKSIKVKRQRIYVEHLYTRRWETHYLPVNADEAEKICHLEWQE